MVTEQTPITLHRGATTELEIDFTGFDFKGGTVNLTIKKIGVTTPIKVFTIQSTSLDTSNIAYLELTPTESKNLVLSDYQFNLTDYMFDMIHVVGTKKTPLCLPSKVYVKDTVGGEV